METKATEIGYEMIEESHEQGPEVKEEQHRDALHDSRAYGSPKPVGVVHYRESEQRQKDREK